ncbi:hypothetical protein EVB41_047 [Rhizobium phage RHph_TM3_14A]|nr:hypothetical protein EVB29_047 [Rhizobium phage RHph_TM27A]QIG66967.1 hypothetical protein EVB30_047 [Rhizobium phage RHph_TM27B]QIG67056.1 hypothetical protein EVB31_046 [Rhizobium phage RHph_TM29]QIG67512.1 hypothetical protein EVB41_047 [Rhizobium phage RHph_TM3_14A]
MTQRMLIPRSRIPKIHAMCPICESGHIGVQTAAPYADGYYRRHKCKECGAAFHTLTPYDGGMPEVSAMPFKDRELSEYEAFQRAQWWKDEARKMDAVTFEVTLLTRMTIALDKKDEQRSSIERYIVSMYHALERKVREMEDQQGDTS